MKPETISYKNNKLKIIDQRVLPGKLIIREINNIKDAYYCIKTLAVRGAPAIGVFAGYGLCVGFKNIKLNNRGDFFKHLYVNVGYLKSARPTAVNLSWALDRMAKVAIANHLKSIPDLKRVLLKEAKSIHLQDKKMCEAIGKNGATLIKKGDTILTHCNAGALATAGNGTALSVIYQAKKDNKSIKVFVDETRPLLQGARLTSWELKKHNIDVTLICDNMAASIMAQGKIQKIVVGADRIAKNGDTANKIGTYNLAVLAKEHKIPFFVAAPSSTFDFSIKNGTEIPIEQRDPDEVRKIKDTLLAPKNIKVYNPAFDITPARLISAIITEKGIFKKPYNRSLKKLSINL